MDLGGLKKVANHLRYELPDEIPNEIQHGTIDGKLMSKAQGGWQHSVIWLVDILKINESLPNDLINSYNSLKDRLQDTNYSKRLTTPEDIKHGNKLLDQVISYIKNKN